MTLTIHLNYCRILKIKVVVYLITGSIEFVLWYPAMRKHSICFCIELRAPDRINDEQIRNTLLITIITMKILNYDLQTFNNCVQYGQGKA